MIRKTWQGAALLGIALLIAAGCGDDKGNGPVDNPYDRMSLDLFAVAPLGDGMVYELWISPIPGLAAASEDWVSVVRFDVTAGTGGSGAQMVDENGVPISGNSLSDIGVDLEDYDSMFVTIEPSPDTDTLPSASIYLLGDIKLNSTTFVVLGFPGPHLETLDTNARFTYATPTDADTTEANELGGVWFMLASQQLGLFGLQPAPDGWIYEGWAKLGNTMLSTGQFVGPEGADQGNPYSGSLPAPLFPGEDFLQNSPVSGLFPYEFQSTDTIMVTVEPVDDPLPATPFPYVIYVNRPGQTLVAGQNFRLDKRDAADGVFPDAQAVILRRLTE